MVCFNTDFEDSVPQQNLVFRINGKVIDLTLQEAVALNIYLLEIFGLPDEYIQHTLIDETEDIE